MRIPIGVKNVGGEELTNFLNCLRSGKYWAKSTGVFQIVPQFSQSTE